jgi:amidophosphoribosyltransferase
MSKIGDFVAFKAAISLLKKHGKEHIIKEVYAACKEQEQLPMEQMTNQVKTIYEHFSYLEISKQIAEIVKPKNVTIPIEVVFQTLDGLHHACPDHKGDWYFSGNYPTPGGNRVVNRAFINYFENKNERAY